MNGPPEREVLLDLESFFSRPLGAPELLQLLTPSPASSINFVSERLKIWISFCHFCKPCIELNCPE
jgi:hypothetical protein